MRILLLHQYFLEKDEGGGSRFNEMTKVWRARAQNNCSSRDGKLQYRKKPEKHKEIYLQRFNVL